MYSVFQLWCNGKVTVLDSCVHSDKRAHIECAHRITGEWVIVLSGWAQAHTCTPACSYGWALWEKVNYGGMRKPRVNIWKRDNAGKMAALFSQQPLVQSRGVPLCLLHIYLTPHCEIIRPPGIRRAHTETHERQHLQAWNTNFQTGWRVSKNTIWNTVPVVEPQTSVYFNLV